MQQELQHFTHLEHANCIMFVLPHKCAFMVQLCFYMFHNISIVHGHSDDPATTGELAISSSRHLLIYTRWAGSYVRYRTNCFEPSLWLPRSQAVPVISAGPCLPGALPMQSQALWRGCLTWTVRLPLRYSAARAVPGRPLASR